MDMFTFAVISEDLDSVIKAIKFLNWSILNVHKKEISILWSPTKSEIGDFGYDVLDDRFIINLHRDDFLSYNALKEEIRIDADGLDKDEYKREFTQASLELLRNQLALCI